MRLAQTIISLLHPTIGVKARDLAVRIGEERSEINSRLYNLAGAGKVRRDDDFNWFLVGSGCNGEGDNVNEKPEADRLDAFSATAEQIPVIEAPASARLFVEAGPGTGKTETLVARLIRLTSSGLSPSEILVLSFSVAAVKELRKRIEGDRLNGTAAIAFIDIRTFDSFASRLLRRVISNQELQTLNYDDRIGRATTEIRRNEQVRNEIREFKHVLLDEMQDLVGVRADLARELLRAAEPGFTLFGDPAQGIYDFTIESGPSSTTSGELLKAIAADFPEMDREHRFTRNFRVGGNEKLERIAVRGRTLLLASPSQARAFLEHEFKELRCNGTTTRPSIQPGLLNASTCVICRTNGQILQLAGQLHQKGVPFSIIRDRNEYLAPAWVGRLSLDLTDPNVRRQDFVMRAVSLLGLDEAQAQKIWTELVSLLGHPRSHTFDINLLRAAINDASVLPEVASTSESSNSVQLSTIHRSKGREFSNVIVVFSQNFEHGERNERGCGEDKVEEDSEPKVLFVALTRAKKSLSRIDATGQSVWMPNERWIKSHPNSNGFKVLSGFQVGLAHDVDVSSFVDAEKDEVVESQEWLIENARPGTAAELWLDHVADRFTPIYKIMIQTKKKSGCVQVGRTSRSFGSALWNTLKKLNNINTATFAVRFPSRIERIWVKDLVTCVGDISNEKIDRCFRTSGLWVGITLDGIGRLEWQKR